MRTLSNRVAVVTGAAGGIGRAIALELATAGMDVVLADLDERGMQATASEITALGRRCTIVPTDVRELAQVEQLLAATLEAHGGCHLMVNNAGILVAAPLLEADHSQWQRVIDVNLWGVLHGCRVFGKYFVRKRQGQLVNVASPAGIFPNPGMTMYGPSKAAVINFTQQLRWELAADGVGVTLVLPGLIKSGIFGAHESGIDHTKVSQILRSARSPQEIARKVRRGVERDKPVVRSGLEPLLFGLLRLLPASLIDLVAKHFTRKLLGFLRGEGNPA